nr:helix-turn-helix domain-containing protein [Bradyrhizobium sp. MOS001]
MRPHTSEPRRQSIGSPFCVFNLCLSVSLGQSLGVKGILYVSRVAHLIFELYAGLATIGRVEGSSFQFPATRALFADAIGTSAVHLNRVVQELRTRGCWRWSVER